MRKKPRSREDITYFYTPKPRSHWSENKKREKSLPGQSLDGVRELSVFWDEGKRYRKEASAIFEAFKRAKNPKNKRLYWELIREGEYRWYKKMFTPRYYNKEVIERAEKWRGRWRLRKLRATRKLKKTAYGYVSASPTLSTIPT